MEEINNDLSIIRPKIRPKIVNLHIPHEIMFDILKRVSPVKSLLRFKCVSRWFCSLMSQVSFIEAHHHQKDLSSDHLLANFPNHLTRQTLITNLNDEKKNAQLDFSLFEYLNEPYFRDLHYLESLNGLICLWNDDKDVVICNPFTRQHVFLPQLMTKKVYFTCCSLGFDPTIKKHKVVMAQRIVDTSPKWNIFTIGVDKSWREIHCYAQFFPMINNCIHIDGVIYSVNFYDFVDDKHIAAFNVGEENVRIISFPHGVKLSLSMFSPKIVEIKGEVALLDHKCFNRTGKIFVYTLIDGTIWVKNQTIELPSKFKEKFMHYGFTSTPKGEIVLIPSLKINPIRLEFMYSFLFYYDRNRNQKWMKFELRGIGKRYFKEVNDSVWCNLVETMWSLI